MYLFACQKSNEQKSLIRKFPFFSTLLQKLIDPRDIDFTVSILCPKCVSAFYGSEVPKIQQIAEFSIQNIDAINLSYCYARKK